MRILGEQETMDQREAVIIEAVRTPVGRYGGALKSIRPDDLAALVLREVVARSGIDPATVDDVLFGAANQAGEDNRNVARMAGLLAGLPVEVPGCTLNRLCASGLEAVNQVAMAIRTGMGDVFLAGGVESMSRAPLVLSKPEQAFDRSQQIHDTTIGWRFTNPKLAAVHHPYGMGETAENIYESDSISREDQDAFALQSHQRAVAAWEEGHFDEEIVPVMIPQRKGDPVIVDRDEGPRPETTLPKLASLKPVFREGGSVTAGNSSSINDGAAALLVMEAEAARALGLRPMARWVASAVAGVDPAQMGLGPIPATRKVLERAGLRLDQIDLIELNEAFAVQALACIRELGLDVEKTNVNGGAIAIGHPLGSTGARLMTTLLHEMRRRESRYGLVTMCVGVGQGIATVVERVSE
jgi:3-oxoadipyl-CoA thiolase